MNEPVTTFGRKGVTNTPVSGNSDSHYDGLDALTSVESPILGGNSRESFAVEHPKQSLNKNKKQVGSRIPPNLPASEMGLNPSAKCFVPKKASTAAGPKLDPLILDAKPIWTTVQKGKLKYLTPRETRLFNRQLRELRVDAKKDRATLSKQDLRFIKREDDKAWKHEVRADIKKKNEAQKKKVSKLEQRWLDKQSTIAEKRESAKLSSLLDSCLDSDSDRYHYATNGNHDTPDGIHYVTPNLSDIDEVSESPDYSPSDGECSIDDTTDEDIVSNVMSLSDAQRSLISNAARIGREHLANEQLRITPTHSEDDDSSSDEDEPEFFPNRTLLGSEEGPPEVINETFSKLEYVVLAVVSMIKTESTVARTAQLLMFANRFNIGVSSLLFNYKTYISYITKFCQEIPDSVWTFLRGNITHVATSGEFNPMEHINSVFGTAKQLYQLGQDEVKKNLEKTKLTMESIDPEFISESAKAAFAGADKEFGEASASFEYVKQTPLFKDAVRVVSSLYTMMISPMFGVFSPETIDWIKKKVMHFETASVILEGLRVLHDLFTGCQIAYSSQDWTDIFRAKNSTKWVHDVSLIEAEVVDALSDPQTDSSVRSTLSARIDALVLEGQKIRLLVPIASPVLTVISKSLDKLREASSMVARSAITSKARPAPIGIQIMGPVAVAKSFVAHAVMSETMAAYGHVPHEDLIWTVGMADKYDSSLTNSKRIAFFDDIGAIRLDYDDTPAAAKVISISNYCSNFAVMADVKDKGTVMYQVDAMVCTSNTTNMGAHSLFTCAAAYLRRWKYLIKVKVRPGYCKIVKGEEIQVLDHDRLKNPDGSTRSAEEALMFYLIIRYPNGSDDSVEERWARVGSIHSGKHYYATFKEMLDWVYQVSTENRRLATFVTSDISLRYEIAKNRVRETPTYHGANGTQFVITLGTVACFVALMWVYSFYFVERLKKKFAERTDATLIARMDNILDNVQARVTARAHKYLTEKYHAQFATMKFILEKCVMGAGAFLIAKLLSRTMFGIGDKPGSDSLSGYAESKHTPYVYPRVRPNPRNPWKSPDLKFPRLQTYTTEERLDCLMERATFGISFTEAGSTQARIGVGFFFFNRYFIFPAHTLPPGYAEKIIEVKMRREHFYCNNFVLTPDQVTILPNDVAVMFVPCMVEHSDLRPYFSKPNLVGEYPEHMVLYHAIYTSKFSMEKKVVSGFGEEFTTHENPHLGTPYYFKTLTANVVSINGNSGSPIVLMGTKPQIVGMLVSRCENHSCFTYLPVISDDVLAKVNVRFATFHRPERKMPVFVKDPSDEDRRFSLAQHVVPSAVLHHGRLENWFGRTMKSNFTPSAAMPFVAKAVGGVYTPQYATPFNWFFGKPVVIPLLHKRVVQDDNGEKIYVDPQLVSLATTAEVQLEPPMDLIDICFSDYMDGFDSLPLAYATPLNLHEIINGADVIPPMNTHTSSGFGLKGKKDEYLETFVDDRGCLQKKFKPNFEKDFLQYETDYANGVDEYPIFVAHIKDEVLSEKKFNEGRARVFFASPFMYTCLSRKYLMPVVTYMYQNPFFFECMVGINAMSPDWKKIHDMLEPYNVFDGDYEKFDKKQRRVIALFYIKLCVIIAREKLGYDDAQCAMIMLILEDGLFYKAEIKGDIFEFLSSIPSGKTVTTSINSFTNSIYIRMAWYQQGRTDSYRKNNILFTFGDDNIPGTKDKNFTFKYVQEQLKVWGINYTPASKTDAVKDFVPLDEITFLKRKFVKSRLKDQDVVLCPLEEQSILRSLMFSKIDSLDQLVDLRVNLVDASKQYFFYGEARFKERRAFLQCVAYKAGITARWPTYDELVDNYLDGTLATQFT